MDLRANVNKNACIGCGICVDICPGLFELDPQGLSEATTILINPSLTSKANLAAEACPTAAISIF